MSSPSPNQYHDCHFDELWTHRNHHLCAVLELMIKAYCRDHAGEVNLVTHVVVVVVVVDDFDDDDDNNKNNKMMMMKKK